MSDVNAFHFTLHDFYEEQAHGSTIVGLEPDEPGEGGINVDPHPVVRVRLGSDRCVVGYEVVRIFMSRHGGLGAVDDEQSGGCESVANLGAVDATVHHVDEDAGDVVAVAGVVFYEL